jgi:hypothetical protein
LAEIAPSEPALRHCAGLFLAELGVRQPPFREAILRDKEPPKVNSSPEPDRRRTAILSAIVVVFVLLSIEATAQALYWFRDALPKETETFQVRTFTRRVADARHVTTVPNFTSPANDAWSISTDAYGFRGGAPATRPDCPSVLFIGDSVPFGYGVSDGGSISSRLFERLRKANDPRCVINAALPSYSLFQAVARFEHEIQGRFRIDALYLQFIDPAIQFARLGSEWRPDRDWTTEQTAVKQKSVTIASISLLRDALRHFGWLRKIDQPALENYRREIRRELEHLHDLAVQAGVKRLVVAPITIPSSSFQRYPEEFRDVIEATNDELSRLSAGHQDTVFLDTIGLMRRYPENEMFVDKCCHLSERGNDLVAEQLMKILVRN